MEREELGGWGKIYESVYERSLVGAGSAVFAVWGYCIAKARPPSGLIELNPAILAAIIGDERGRIEKAIGKLCSPDRESHTKGQDGRRLEQVGPYTFRMINWKLYRGPKSPGELREYYRKKQSEYRARQRAMKDSNVPEWKAERAAKSKEFPKL